MNRYFNVREVATVAVVAPMSLSAATRLGPYEITGTLGAGGMEKCIARVRAPFTLV